MSLWMRPDSPRNGYESNRPEAYGQYSPVQREPSFPKECQICWERIKPGREIIARMDGRQWSVKHRECDEKQHSLSVISPAPKAMQSREVQTDLIEDPSPARAVNSDSIEPVPLEPVPFLMIGDLRENEAEPSSPMGKITNGLKEVASGVWDAVRSNPGKVLLSGFVIVAVACLGIYTAQEYELRCVKGPIDGVAYCAEIPAGLTAEEKADLVFTKNIMEGQYYPSPDRETCTYSEIAGREEFTPLAWTSYFGK